MLLIVLLLLAVIPILFAIAFDKRVVKPKEHIKTTMRDYIEIMPKKHKKNIYKKLSGFGKLVWFGLYTGIALLFTGREIMSAYDPYVVNSINQNTIHIAGVFGFIGFVLIITCIIGSFFNGVYCEYKYELGVEKKWFSVSGRISRLSYLGYTLTYFIALVVIDYITQNLMEYLVLIVPFAIVFGTAAIRRAQDCGCSIWVPFIPIVNIIILYCCPGDKGDNDYGPVSLKSTKTQKKSKSKIKEMKIEIVNNEKYLTSKKASRLKYLKGLLSQVVLELERKRCELENENNKLKNIPSDAAKYIKSKDVSVLKEEVVNLELKMKAIEDLIELERVVPEEKAVPIILPGMPEPRTVGF